MPQRLHDRRASQAVLISSFPCGHPRSASVAENLDRLRELLIDDRRWGLKPENCVRLTDPTTAQEVGATMTAAGRGVKGSMLLVYFAGHIVFSADRQLYLALPGTRPDALNDTAISVSRFGWVPSHSGAGQGLVVMDCCHDGLPAPDGPQDDVLPARFIAERSVIERTCLLVAAPTDHPEATDPTADSFSAGLNTLLTHGLPHGPILLDTDTVTEWVAGRHWLVGAHESVPLARNFALYGPDRVGQVLCAAPVVDDPELREAVVVILRYDRDEGALGVIVNRPEPQPGGDVAGAWADSLSGPKVVFKGGPVSHEGYIMLVELRAEVSGEPVRFRRVSGALGVLPLSYEPSAIGATVARSRLFSGYLGWRPGELETDLAQRRLVAVEATPEVVFSTEPDRLWGALRRLP